MEGINLTTVLKRLEAATSRLEDIVVFSERNGSSTTDASRASTADNGNVFRPSSDQISPRSSAHHVATDIPPLPISGEAPHASAASTITASSTTKDAGLLALEDIAEKDLSEFVSLSSSIAEGVQKQAEAVKSAFAAMLNVVELASRSAKPEMDQLVQILKPMNEQAAQVEQLRDTYRKDRDLTNFLATVPAGVGALGWVTIEGKNYAAEYIQEMRDSAQFYGNRVLKDRKDAKPWVDKYIGFLEALRKAVVQHYPEGLKWNANAPPAQASDLVGSSASKAAPAPAPAASGGGAPPPPPPPPSVDQLTASLGSTPAAASASPAAGGGLSGVFAELSQGESIASHLKPVDKTALKASKPPVPKSTKPKPGSGASSSSSGSSSSASGAARSAKLVPRIELVESKWHVEDLDDRHDVEITTSLGQSVQIDNCRNCTIKILGKAATFNMSRCKKVGLLVETMVASCDIVNCSDFGLQVTGTVPSLMIDQSSQGAIYLSEESIGVDIFTSQTTAINVNIPEGEPGAYREVPLGEQILHNIVGGQVKSSVVKHG